MNAAVNGTEVVLSVNGRYGKISFPVHDDPIGRSMQEFGEWGQLELEKVLSLINPGDWVLDIGANVGSYTLAFSDKVGPSGRVLAFEAQPYLCNLLEKTIRSNGINNTIVSGSAVSDVEDVLYFDTIDYSEHVNAGAVKLSSLNIEGKQVVQALTIDKLDLERCDLIKCDVEGMSCNVLVGAKFTINKFKPIVVSEVNDVKEGVDLYNALKSFNYDVWLVQSDAFNPGNFYGNKNNIFGHAAELSIISAHPSNQLCVDPDTFGSKILSHDQLASLILACPRYGDATPHDRNPIELNRKNESLLSKLEVLEDNCNRLSYRNKLLETRIADSSHLRSQIEDLKTTLCEVRHEYEAVHAQLSRVYSSRSWWLTKPFRFCARTLRKMIGGV
ncbi:FkbM family methyltransferase [Brucella thiophenivorans]|nr:FkbM family methyltransferase [Brucella thiophenivorans]